MRRPIRLELWREEDGDSVPDRQQLDKDDCQHDGLQVLAAAIGAMRVGMVACQVRLFCDLFVAV